LDLESGRRHAANQWWRVRLQPDRLLAPGRSLFEIDYRRVEDPHRHGAERYQARREGVCHGWCVWFEAHLHDGVSFSTGPEHPPTVYQHAFFPLLEPVVVAPGDEMALDLEARLVGSHYLWRWNTRVQGPNGASAPKATFRQDMFAGKVFSADWRRRRRPDFVPALKDRGRAARRALDLLDSGRAVAQISEHLASEFPALFATPDDARPFVDDLSDYYCE
jgi:hypothetical protein